MLPEYRAAAEVRGALDSVGSDSLNNLMTRWSEGFARFYPAVKIQIQGNGSSSVPTALLEGTARFGIMSREMSSSEINAFRQRYGYQPQAIPLGLDALAIYVNKDNPLIHITLADVDAIFSVARRCGGHRNIMKWGELGLTNAWSNRAIEAYSRHAASGSYLFFKSRVLCGGDMKSRVNELPGSASVMNGVAGSLNGIGYASAGQASAGVKSLALLIDGASVEPSRNNVMQGRYPLVRTLYMYFNNPPEQSLPILEAEFLRWILSRQGQDIVVREGYLPLPVEQVRSMTEQFFP